jgi:adenosylhomocysteine nucleosidase
MQNNFTVGIIGAMDCEVNALKLKLENLEEHKFCNFEVSTGNLFNNRIVLAKSGVGKVNAAISTQFIIDKFKVDYIINTGIAGGISSELSIGDIIAGNELVQYDFDVSSLGYAKGYMCTGKNPNLPTIYTSSKELIDNFIISMKNSSKKVIVGRIASGDMFVSDVRKKQEISELFGAISVEMEGAAIAQTATANNIPFLIIRTISDLADNSASTSHRLVETEMAELSLLAVESLLKQLSENTKKALSL